MTDLTHPLDQLRSGALAGATRFAVQADLREFPRELFDLADTLEVLDLSGNQLTDLPADFDRLHRLKVLFCSGNPMARLPPVLGGCASLSQIGFRGCGLREVPAQALPVGLRWLTLTDNCIEVLPAALGERPALQKLMLSGNRLQVLPESLAGLVSLELLRLSANRFTHFPAWLCEMPRLAWLAWAGQPLDAAVGARSLAAMDVAWNELRVGEWLGEGASGRIVAAEWRGQPVAVKLFKGAMTSDGLPDAEMAACLAAGPHPSLMAALGRLTGHPDGAAGLVMPRLPRAWRPLAGPPSLASCSRDVYDVTGRFELAAALRLARHVGVALAQLHGCGLLHGDVYAHNTLWDGVWGNAVLSDFGAAFFTPTGMTDAAPLQRLEVRAWGILLGELLDLSERVPGALYELQRQCVQPKVSSRPLMTEALYRLNASMTDMAIQP